MRASGIRATVRPCGAIRRGGIILRSRACFGGAFGARERRRGAVRVVRRCSRAVPAPFAAHFASRLAQSRTGGSCPPANRSSLSFRVGVPAASGLMRPPKNGFFMPARTDVRAGMCAYGAKNPASPRAVLPNKRIRREANRALRAECGHLGSMGGNVGAPPFLSRRVRPRISENAALARGVRAIVRGRHF